MTFDVIHDPNKQIAALIDPDLGRALGPIAAGGPEGVRALEAFVGALDQDPATIHPSDLDASWREFLSFLAADREVEAEQAGEQAAPAGEQQQAKPVDQVAAGGGEIAQAGGEQVPQPGGPEEAREAGGGASTDETEGEIASATGEKTTGETAAPAGAGTTAVAGVEAPNIPRPPAGA